MEFGSVFGAHFELGWHSGTISKKCIRSQCYSALDRYPTFSAVGAGMNWQNVCSVLVVLLERFEDEAPRIPVGRASSPVKAFRNIVATEKRTTGKVDRAVVNLLRGKTIANSRQESYFLAQRLKFGLVIARALSTPASKNKGAPILPKSSQPAQVIRCLLVDVWHSTNRHLWHTILKAMLDASLHAQGPSTSHKPAPSSHEG